MEPDFIEINPTFSINRNLIFAYKIFTGKVQIYADAYVENNLFIPYKNEEELKRLLSLINKGNL